MPDRHMERSYRMSPIRVNTIPAFGSLAESREMRRLRALRIWKARQEHMKLNMPAKSGASIKSVSNAVFDVRA